ncbi:hypothetical protein BG015_005774 [Linnemannia schmuckeri]|uniref:Uncharacterized protein n=1 Tax=Linnemannia schmuckeri TaxID=64567 RepID=A0A9P5R2L7_9FUNG|nr:hypothetical protein BG015_005774 [Linnemannia schmuckeri]
MMGVFLNMMLVLEVLNSNQSNNMQDLKNMMTKLDGKLAQQRILSAWTNDMLAALAKAHISYKEQVRVLQENMQALQQATDTMARQQLVTGSLMPGNSGYFGFPAPGHFPHQGPSASSRPTTREHKQSKSGKDHKLVAIQPSLPRAPQGPPAPAVSSRPHSEVEQTLMARPFATRPMPLIDMSGPDSADGQAAETGPNSPSQSSLPLPTPDREDWFDIIRDHSSAKSVYEEHQRFERALDEKLGEKNDKGKRPHRLEKRQSNVIEMHTSNCYIVASEVDLLKKRRCGPVLRRSRHLQMRFWSWIV